MAKHIFVTGGVVSSLGKGITAASLGHLLKARGYNVTMQKMDPYLNVDPGTMSPFQHGEVFVTDDGHEGDLDLGHYERFIDENLSRESNFTQGSIYQSLVARERHGDFLGGTVQVIPHVTDAIKERILRAASQTGAHIVISEIGGTIGDIEGQPFIEAVRQLRHELGPDNVVFVHVSLVPYITAAHEVKTKPTQHSVKEMRSMGVQPDFIVCRSDKEIDDSVRAKIAHFCDVDVDSVLSCVDAPSIYEVPLNLYAQSFDVKVLRRLKLPECELSHVPMADYVEAAAHCKSELDIAVVGKYTQLPDAYLSVIEALRHAGAACHTHVNVHLIDGEELSDDRASDVLKHMDGILVPGGFGQRAFEGKIAAARFARENNIPYLGICLGLQAAVCEFARHVAGIRRATSAEFADEPAQSANNGTNTPRSSKQNADTSANANASANTKASTNADVRTNAGANTSVNADESTSADAHDAIPLVIDLMPDQIDVHDKGGTMRLGAYPCKVAPGTLAHAAYRSELVYERHRHRYEVSNSYRQQLVDAGLVLSGLSPDDRLTEIIELPDHPWFVATQAHPEFKSRPGKPHPLFHDFIAAAQSLHNHSLR